MKYFCTFSSTDSRKLVYVLLGSLIIAGLFLPSYRALDYLELKTYDLRVSSWFNRAKPVPEKTPRVVLVNIDDRSMDRIEQSWPWSRKLYADMINILNAAGAKIIGFDIYMIAPSKSDRSGDIELARTLEQAGNVVLASYISFPDAGSREQNIMIPIPEFESGAAGIGFCYGEMDLDKSVRKVKLFHLENDFYPSFGISVVSRYLSATGLVYSPEENCIKIIHNSDTVPEKIIRIPVVEKDKLRLSFACTGLIKEVSFIDVMDGNYDPALFRDAIVLVGSTAPVLHDVYTTPLGIMPGVKIQATGILTMLTRDFIFKISRDYSRLLLLLYAILAGLAILVTTPLLGTLAAVLMIIFHVLLAFSFLIWLNLWIPLMKPVLVIIFVYVTVTVLKLIWSTLENIRLYKMAITDSLTGLYVHRYFQIKLAEERERAFRYGLPLSLIVTDIDHFKKFNDNYGHQIGDRVLKAVAECLQQSCRVSDTVARYGGEEFAIILPHTDREDSLKLAERLRVAVEENKVPYKDGFLTVTISLGVMTAEPGEKLDNQTMVKQADQALYQAKERGRNRVVAYRND